MNGGNTGVYSLGTYPTRGLRTLPKSMREQYPSGHVLVPRDAGTNYNPAVCHVSPYPVPLASFIQVNLLSLRD